MKIVCFLLPLIALISCKQLASPELKENIMYPYTNKVMDNTIEKGKSCVLIQKGNYKRNDVIVFDYDDLYEGKKDVRLVV
jgi:hypothetical protein